MQGPIQHELLTWQPSITEQLRQRETVDTALKRPLKGLNGFGRWIPVALPLTVDHPGGCLHGFSVKKRVCQHVRLRSTWFAPLLLRFPTQTVGDVSKSQAVAQLAAIHQHVKVNGDQLSRSLQHGLTKLLTLAFQG